LPRANELQVLVRQQVAERLLLEMTKYAIITPYFHEDKGLIERCLASVARQTIAADHIVVADGCPQDWLDDTPCRHIKLDRPHGDFGNTPRGIGAMLAASEGYAGIGFLDADNWLEEDHIEACVAASRTAGDECDFVIAKRTFRRPDETIMPLPEEPGHVDTNCFFFLRGSFGMLPQWALMPKELSAIGDRYFLAMIGKSQLKSATVPRPTVNYQCLWRSYYDALGETAPANAKPNIDRRTAEEWVAQLAPRELEILRRLTGLSFR
jgi:glycosyltransferase involved in cell wall biosynthesis